MTRIALVQLASPDTESQIQRIERVEATLLSYAGAGIDLFVLPELWSAGYLAFEHYDELSEPINGPTVGMCRRVAVALGAWVHVGSFIERDESGLLHNTTVMLDPAGNIAQTYRKIHVFGYESLEAKLLTPGESLSVSDSPLGQTASTTCYDLRFPHLWLELGSRGAQAAIVPAAWPAARRGHFQLFTEARAVEHQLWVVAVNACGLQGEVELGGASRVVDPWGRVIHECSYTDEEVAIVEIDPTLVDRVRSEFPVLGDRLSPTEYASLRQD